MDRALYHSFFLHAPIGAYILSPSADPIILDVNNAFLRNVGYTREQLVGHYLFQALPADPNDPFDTGVEALRASLARAIQTGLPQSMPTQRYPIRTVDKDGVEVFVERFWNAVNTPIFDEHGVLLCIYHVTSEVTEQKRAEEALRLSQHEALRAAREAEAGHARLNAVLQAVPVGIMMTDSNGKVLESNSAHAALWSHSPLAKDTTIDFSEWRGWWADGSERQGQAVAPDEWPLVQALRGHPQAHALIEIETLDESRTHRIVVCSATPIRDREGQVSAGVVALLDMTERLKAEKALRESDRRKDEFLAMLAHELRNPLAPIMVAAELLSRTASDGGQVGRTSAIILRQVKHLTGLVDDLLDVSRVTRGLVVIDKRRVDLRSILAQAVEQVLPLVSARHHQLDLPSETEPLTVCGDVKRLIQVFANLLNNAAKYTPPGGRIQVGMDVREDRIHVAVSDNGIGMSEDLIANAFELFVQAERTADRAQGGLGIGLAVVKRLVELHGGVISASSGGSGKGSRFTVVLPLLPNDADVAPTAPVPASAKPAVPLRIVVVDDNIDAAEVLAMSIAADGHEVATEHASAAALRTAADTPADVYLLDIGLPEIDGFALARRLRTNPSTAHAVLIAVTGYGRDEDRLASKKAGFDFHFVKPVDVGDLTALLAEIASSRRASPRHQPSN
ncbi:PAS domain S-box-containing protein [Massilia sp. PDC64]|nr:PAS domain S-box-containing protein [Massilia sp. PDC64]